MAELAELAQIWQPRGLEPALAQEVARQLTASDALAAHARDELGLTEVSAARPVQAARHLRRRPSPWAPWCRCWPTWSPRTPAAPGRGGGAGRAGRPGRDRRGLGGAPRLRARPGGGRRCGGHGRHMLIGELTGAALG